jgi:hypothetical protein
MEVLLKGCIFFAGYAGQDECSVSGQIYFLHGGVYRGQPMGHTGRKYLPLALPLALALPSPLLLPSIFHVPARLTTFQFRCCSSVTSVTLLFNNFKMTFSKDI